MDCTANHLGFCVNRGVVAMDEHAKTSDPMDGSSAEFTPQERSRIRAATKWVEGAQPVINPFVVVMKNWKAWVVGLAILAVMRRPEIIAVLDLIAGKAQ